MARPKLLLADDSVTIRKVVELTFADEGIDVTTVADAETAMQKFVEIQPDIVLVDIGLPGTAGYQICEMIKQDEATKNIPVLLLVGSFEPFDQDEAERVCSDGFLTKPFHSIRDLVARVWDLLGRETAVEQPVEAQVFAHTADTADIENLYDSSFVNTAEIEEFDTVDDLLGDPSMDDELIEASSPSSNGTAPTSDAFSQPEDHAATTKEFDWSQDSLVEPAAERVEHSDDSNYPFNDLEVQPVDLPESSGTDYEASNDEAAVSADSGTELRYEEEPLDGDHIESPDTAITDPADHVASSEPEASAEDNDNSWPEADADSLRTSSYEDGSPFAQTVETSTSEIDAARTDSSSNEPSPELIALVAQRVIDRLSDQVIRDIAKEAVPRIAEKLIREALEQESKA